jgi:hypothetical protein
MNKEDRIRLEASQMWVRIDKLIMKTKAEQNAAGQELDDLTQRLPQMLLAMTMGNVSKGEVKAMKERMTELREILKDAPVILQELEREKRRRCLNPLQDACFLSKDRGRYNGLKEQLLKNCEAPHVEELRKCARDIDEEEDCERFLSNLSPSVMYQK